MKELEAKYKSILEKTDPTHHDDMLALLHSMDEQGVGAREIGKQAKELNEQIDACPV